MAKQGFRVMDSDLHVMEPCTLWDEYLDPKFRGRIVTVPQKYDGTRAFFGQIGRGMSADLFEQRLQFAFPSLDAGIGHGNSPVVEH